MNMLIVGDRNSHKLLALKRTITRSISNFEIDDPTVLETTNRCIAELNQILSQHTPRKVYDGTSLAVLQMANELPTRLIEGRIMLGWTQRELARQAQIKPEVLCRYEKNRYAKVNMSKAIEIAGLLKRAFDDQTERTPIT